MAASMILMIACLQTKTTEQFYDGMISYDCVKQAVLILIFFPNKMKTVGSDDVWFFFCSRHGSIRF